MRSSSAFAVGPVTCSRWLLNPEHIPLSTSKEGRRMASFIAFLPIIAYTLLLVYYGFHLFH